MKKNFTQLTVIIAILLFSAWGANAQLTTIVNSNFTNWTVAPTSNANGDGKIVYNIPGADIVFKGPGYNPTSNQPGAPADVNFPSFFRFGTNMNPQFPVSTLPVTLENQYFKISPSQEFIAGGKITFVVSANGDNTAFQVGDLSSGALLGEPNIVNKNTITTLTLDLPATFSGKKDIIIGRKSAAIFLYAIKIETNSVATPQVALTAGENPASATISVAMEPVVYTYSNVADDANVLAGWFTDNTYTTTTSQPAGLSLTKDTDAKTVTLSGTPTAVGAYYYSVKINETEGNEIQASVVVADYSEPTPSVALTSGSITASATHHMNMVPVVYTYENVADAANVKFVWYTDNSYSATASAPEGLQIDKNTENKTLTLSGSAVYDGSYFYKVYIDEEDGNEIEAQVEVSGKFICSQDNINNSDWVTYTYNNYASRKYCTDNIDTNIPNLSSTDRKVVFNITNCESFTIYGDGNKETRYLSYQINDEDPIQTAAWPNGCSSQTFETGNTGNITLTIAGVSGSVYLAIVEFNRSLNINSFEVNGKAATIDHELNTISLDLEEGTALTALEANVSSALGTTVSPNGQQDFSNSESTPVEYTVQAGSQSKVYQVTITANNKSTATQQIKSNSISFDGQQVLNPDKTEIHLYDAAGRLLVSSNSNIDMKDRLKGIYIVKSQGVQLKIAIVK